MAKLKLTKHIHYVAQKSKLNTVKSFTDLIKRPKALEKDLMVAEFLANLPFTDDIIDVKLQNPKFRKCL